jgi:hypothetical protein
VWWGSFSLSVTSKHPFHQNLEARNAEFNTMGPGGSTVSQRETISLRPESLTAAQAPGAAMFAAFAQGQEHARSLKRFFQQLGFTATPAAKLSSVSIGLTN